MKRVLYIAGTIALLTFAADQGLEAEKNVHYLRERGKDEGIRFFTGSTTTSQQDDDAQKKAREDLKWKADKELFEDANDVTAPADAPPSTVQIGPYEYTIHWRTHKQMPEAFGKQWGWAQKILLNRNQGADKYRETLLHEIMHACREVGNRQIQSVNEDQWIEATAPTLLNVLQANPALAAWLEKR